MNPHERVGVLSGDKLSVAVDPSLLGAEPNDGDNYGRGFECAVDHSFGTVSGGSGRDTLTVTLRAGLTRLRVGGEAVVFDGYRYFPSNYKDEDVDVGGAKVDFAPDDGGDYWPDHIDDRHPARNLTVDGLIDGFDRGTIEVLPKRD